jgi:hypothetical protein
MANSSSVSPSRAADPVNLLDGTWRLALGDHDRVLSVNAKEQTALYCDGGHYTEGPYTVDRVVGSAVFLSVAGAKPLHLVIYIQGAHAFLSARKVGPLLPLRKTPG